MDICIKTCGLVYRASETSVSQPEKRCFMTQMEKARAGIISPEITRAAQKEKMDAEFLRQLVAKGEVVIPCNINHQPEPCAIGRQLSTKVNANIGKSTLSSCPGAENSKLNIKGIMELASEDAIRREWNRIVFKNM